MANVRISDLPDAITPLDTTTTFFEVQAIENGVDVSRRVRGDMITFTIFPPATIDGSVVRGNSTSGLYEETGLLLVSDTSANTVRIDGLNNNGSALAELTLDAPIGFDSAIRLEENSVLNYRMFYDTSSAEMKFRSATGVSVRFEEGNGVVLMMTLDPIAGQQTMYAGTAGSDVPVMRTVLPASGGLEVDNQVTGAGFERVLTTSDAGGGGLANAGDITTGIFVKDPTTVGAGAQPAISFDDNVNTQFGFISMGDGGLGDAAWGSSVLGQPLSIVGQEGGGGGQRRMAEFDPDAGFTLYYEDGVNMLGQSGGASLRSTTGNIVVFDFEDNGATTIGQISNNNGLFTLDGLVASAGFGLIARARDAGGTARIMIRANPNNDVELYQVGVSVARTATSAAGGFEVNNTATGAGFERVLTTSDLGGGGSLGALSDVTLTSVADGNGFFYDGGSSQWVNTNLISVLDGGRGTYMQAAVTTTLNDIALQVLNDSVNVLDKGSSSDTHITFGNVSGWSTLPITSVLAEIGHFGSDELQIRGAGSGGVIRLANANAAETLAEFVPNAAVTGYFNNIINWGGFNQGFRVYSTVGNQTRLEFYDNTPTELCEINGNGGLLTLQGLTNGLGIQARARDAGGVDRALWTFDPDTGFILYHSAGQQVMNSSNGGIDIRDPNGTTVNIFLEDSAGNIQANITSFSTDLDIRNRNNGGQINLEADDTGGTTRNMVVGDPDGNVQLFQAGVATARTTTAAAGGLEANNTSTGAGFERVLTTSDLGGGFQRAKKNSSTSRSTTTMSADPDMQFASLAAGNYEVEVVLLVQANDVNADIRVALVWSGAVNDSRGFIWNGPIDTNTSVDYDGTGIVSGQDISSTAPTNLSFGVISSSVTAIAVTCKGAFDANGVGNLEVHWARDGGSGTTTVLAQSYIKVLSY